MFRLHRIFIFNLFFAFLLMAQEGIVQDNNDQSVSLDTYIQLMKADLKTKKIALISEAMEFTPEEESNFWPIYNKYDAEKEKIFDKELTILKEYAENYENMSAELAENLLDRSFKLDEQRMELKKDYFKKFKKVLPTVKAVKFFQVDRRITMLIELQIMANVPVLK